MTMDCMRMRIREGCRGGQEQFTWKSIKDQEFKDRECYLGQSTKVGMMGKFGRYHLHDWYARKRDTAESINTEMSAVQAYEEELMQEALGLKPKKLILSKHQMTEEEMKQLFQKDKAPDQQGREAMGPQKKIVTNEYGEQIETSNEDYVAVAAREAPIKGVGFASHRTAKLERIKAETWGTVSELQGSKSQGSSPPCVKIEQVEGAEVKSESMATDSPRPKIKEEQREVKGEPRSPDMKRRRDEEDSEERCQQKAMKEEKKRRKIEKKLKKKEKKEKKKAAKRLKKREKEAAKKTRRGNVSSSSSNSSSSS